MSILPYWIYSIVLLFCSLQSYALDSTVTSSPKIFEMKEIIALYDSKKYQEALNLLQSLPLENREENPHYTYNLGTLYFRLGKLGYALAYLEKANRIKPHDTDIQFNLSETKAALLKKQNNGEQIDQSSPWIEQLADRVSLDEARATLGFMSIAMVLLWMRAFLRTRNLKHTFFNRAALLGFSGFVLTASLYLLERWANNTPPAICLEKTEIRSGPGKQFLELGALEEGSKIRLLGSESKDESSRIWKQVRYSTEEVGWIPASNLLTL